MQGNDRSIDNNTENFEAGWEAAGVKGATTVGAVFDSNKVHDNRNGAVGLWCDIDCYDITYTNNMILDNSGSGILYEISDTASITGNTVKGNGPSGSCCGSSCGAGTGCSFYSGGQIVVSASPNVTVSGNTTSGAMGIGVLQQFRPDACDCPTGSPNKTCCSTGPCGGTSPYHHVYNVSIHDNDITETQSGPGAGTIAGLVTDFCDGTCGAGTATPGAACDAAFYFGASIVQFGNNAYHLSACSDADWAWKNTSVAFSPWQGSGQDGTGTCGL